MSPKDFYRTYQADDSFSELSKELLNEVLKYDPVHVLDFGCGTGKHLASLNTAGVCTIGIDISPMNVYKAIHKYDLPCVICSDETYLRNFCNVDVVFTCSVLDHIEDVSLIVGEFQRIANKAVILAETTSNLGEYYYFHNYEEFGFEMLSFQWTGDDNGIYNIWKWEKLMENDNQRKTATRKNIRA